MVIRKLSIGLASAALVFGLAACGGDGNGSGDGTTGATGTSDASSGEAVTLQYWLWDDTQQPLYQQCADDFTAENPNINIEITQTAWGQYWSNLTTQIAAGSAPDVFTNHVAYYPQFVANGQILDLTSYIDEAGIDLTQYAEGFPERWVIDDKRYGLPKDWDAVGLLYNVERATAAGFDAEAMNNLTWNPDDGGTFGEFVRATTVDADGNTAADAGFNKDNVETYGYYPEWADGAVGQNGWGNFAHANGFTYSDQEGIPTEFNYDSPEMIETATWLQSLISDGLAPRFDQQSSLGTDAVMQNQNAASTIVGSWTMATYLDDASPVEFAYAKLPEGPAGRFAATNSLSDAVWAGTEHPDAAYAWVEYLGSAACQDKVGEAGRIFPALKSGTEKALAAYQENGFDPTPFVEMVADGETYAVPAFDKGSELGTIIQDAMWKIADGADPAESLTAANEQANKLFG